VAVWLTDQGEPFDTEASHTFALGALPLRLVMSPDQDAMQAWIEVTADAPLVRMVELLFALSVRAGADVRLAGAGEVTRASLWLRLADEQDRVRLAEAFRRAEDRGNREDALQRLWPILAAFSPGRDLRWDAAKERIVEMVEVGGPCGISIAEASWIVETPKPGDVVPQPVEGHFHILAWRWLSDAHPGLAEP
jgi:hypothetical protein